MLDKTDSNLKRLNDLENARIENIRIAFYLAESGEEIKKAIEVMPRMNLEFLKNAIEEILET